MYSSSTTAISFISLLSIILPTTASPIEDIAKVEHKNLVPRQVQYVRIHHHLPYLLHHSILPIPSPSPTLHPTKTLTLNPQPGNRMPNPIPPRLLQRPQPTNLRPRHRQQTNPGTRRPPVSTLRLRGDTSVTSVELHWRCAGGAGMGAPWSTSRSCTSSSCSTRCVPQFSAFACHWQ